MRRLIEQRICDAFHGDERQVELWLLHTAILMESLLRQAKSQEYALKNLQISSRHMRTLYGEIKLRDLESV